MDVDDLLDMLALYGVGVVRQYLWRLPSEAQADLRDLLTLRKCGRTRYDAVLASYPPARVRRRERPMLGEAWTTYNLTYTDRSGAVARARILQQQYMAIEIVKNGASQWEVRYDDPVPTGTPPFEEARSFKTQADAIDRARALRAYGFSVIVRGSGDTYFCRITKAPAKPAVPTKIGIDSTHASKDAADTRTHALKQVGYTAAFSKAGPAWAVEITALPYFKSPIGGSTTSTTGSTSSKPASGRTHTVKPGDTLYKIASTYGTTVAEVQAANGLTSTSITVGQVLTIPSASSTTAPATAPKPAAPKTPPRPATGSAIATIVNPPAPSTITALFTSMSVGHDPTKDWASGKTRKDSLLHEADLSTVQTGAGTGAGTLLILKGTTVTLKRAKDDWVEVEAPVHEKKAGKSPVAAGTATGWIERVSTTMTRGIFKDVRIDDQGDKYPKQLHGKLAKADIKAIVLHQTGGAKGSRTLSAYTSQTTGSHYLIDETGAVILVVPLNVRAFHVTPDKAGYTAYSNSYAVGIEHSGAPLKLEVPWPRSATRAADLAAIRSTIQATALSPRLKGRLLGLGDSQLTQLAKDNRDEPVKEPDDWQLYHDINGPQKRASFLLVHKLMTELGVDDAHVYAHETVQRKTVGEGENIREFLTARAAYPGLVTRLEALAAADATLSKDATLTAIITTEKALVDALRLDGTAAENTAVASGTDAVATARERRRSHFYDDFWFHYTQLDELVDLLKTSGSTNPMLLAAKLTAWKT
ncbi:MAG: LysM peptidoglycan-binding domain-containing protein [Deltaproteobacteria bacterium]|nr:LysM peptidoglycan-binding domain-containing protein [Deltaproteobacteria bacterium]